MKKTAVHRIPVSGNESVVVDWTAPSGANPIAIFIHGFGSHRRGDKAVYFAVRFVDMGWGYLSVDLRGHGDSDGSLRDLTMTRLLADINAVAAWLPSGGAPFLVIGSSMGAAAAAWHLLGTPLQVRGAAMIGPSLRFPSAMVAAAQPGEMEAWKRTGVRRVQNEWLDKEIGYGLAEDSARYPSERLFNAYKTPTLIFHGMQDTAVDWKQSLEFAEACPSPEIRLLLIKDGDHRLTEHKKLLFETMLSWWNALKR